MNKKAFELSINFIVILIISIVIFGFGIKFFYDLMHQADELSSMTLKQINAQLEDILCDSSERICIGTSTKEIRPNKVGVFTVGILNTGDESEFYIDVKESDSDDIPQIGKKYWMLKNELTLDPNEQEKVGIAVQIPGGTKKGTYVLNVYVCKDESISCEKDSTKRYGTTQKIYVVVP